MQTDYWHLRSIQSLWRCHFNRMSKHIYDVNWWKKTERKITITFAQKFWNIWIMFISFESGNTNEIIPNGQHYSESEHIFNLCIIPFFDVGFFFPKIFIVRGLTRRGLTSLSFYLKIIWTHAAVRLHNLFIPYDFCLKTNDNKLLKRTNFRECIVCKRGDTKYLCRVIYSYAPVLSYMHDEPKMNWNSLELDHKNRIWHWISGEWRKNDRKERKREKNEKVIEKYWARKG